MIIEARRHSPANPDYSAAEEMMGLGGRRGAGGVLPSLASYTAGSLRDKAAILNQSRLTPSRPRPSPMLNLRILFYRCSNLSIGLKKSIGLPDALFEHRGARCLNL